MKVDPATFASLRRVLLERRPGLDEVEAVYSHADGPPLAKDGVVRLLQYLNAHGPAGGYLPLSTGGRPVDTLDVADARSGLRATVAMPRPSSDAPDDLPLLPLRPDAVVIRKERIKSVGLPEYRLRVNMKRETPVPAGAADAEAVQAFSPLRAGAGQLTYRLKRRYSFAVLLPGDIAADEPAADEPAADAPPPAGGGGRAKKSRSKKGASAKTARTGKTVVTA